MRLTNNEVLTFCADDAHGAPIMMKADELSIEPTAFIDEIKKNHLESLAKFGIEYTNYHSTHSKENEVLVSEIYLDAKSSGYILKKRLNNVLMSTSKCSWQTDMLLGNALNVQQ
jgi:methionyl-tRNA synthetase